MPTQELPFTEDVADWLAATAQRERAVSRFVVVIGVLVVLSGGFVGLIVAGLTWLVTGDVMAVAFELVIEAVVVGVFVFVWRRLRERQSAIGMDLRESAFLRTTGDLTFQYVSGGVDFAGSYQLALPGRTLTLDALAGSRLLATLRHRRDASVTKSGSRTTITIPDATADYTRNAGVLLALRDSAGELVYGPGR
jgi:hypothetical protein